MNACRPARNRRPLGMSGSGCKAGKAGFPNQGVTESSRMEGIDWKVLKQMAARQKSIGLEIYIGLNERIATPDLVTADNIT